MEGAAYAEVQPVAFLLLHAPGTHSQTVLCCRMQCCDSGRPHPPACANALPSRQERPQSFTLQSLCALSELMTFYALSLFFIFLCFHPASAFPKMQATPLHHSGHEPLRLVFLSLEFSTATFSGNGVYAQSQVTRGLLWPAYRDCQQFPASITSRHCTASKQLAQLLVGCRSVRWHLWGIMCL